MAEKMLMLALSPTMEEGTIVTWHKKEGDTVASGDTVCEVETDKATMDYESLQEGTLLKILIEEGQSAMVEQPIAIIGEEGEDVSSLVKEIEAAAEPAEKPEGEEKPVGKAEAEEKPAAAPEAAAEQKAPAESESKSEPESKVKETGVAVKQGPSPAGEAAAGGAPQGAGTEEEGRIKASPLARNMAAEAGIDLTALSGSGPDGRIVKQDVEEAMKSG
ncbi:MAG: E3 binding domain-containing protein, partial [Sediminispirochaetaceae bacterium]